jgi:hypothetical protein
MQNIEQERTKIARILMIIEEGGKELQNN